MPGSVDRRVQLLQRRCRGRDADSVSFIKCRIQLTSFFTSASAMPLELVAVGHLQFYTSALEDGQDIKISPKILVRVLGRRSDFCMPKSTTELFDFVACSCSVGGRTAMIMRSRDQLPLSPSRPIR